MRFILFSLVLIIAGCGMDAKHERAEIGAEEEGYTPEKGQTIVIDTLSSTIKWRGTKKLGSETTGVHFGDIKIDSGFVKVDKNQLSGGKFRIDMAEIRVLDELKDKQKKKLIAHLMSDHFFASDNYPFSHFEIVEVSKLKSSPPDNFEISGNLTIRDTTLAITFPADITIKDSTIQAHAAFAIDRTHWGINYRHEEKSSIKDAARDWFINDEIDLEIYLVARLPNS